MDKKKVKKMLENTPPEERAAAWEQYVRAEVTSLLDTFLPEAVSGNVGIKYDYPIKGVSPKTGITEYDETKATGVFLSIMFDFAAPIQFFEGKPVDKKVE